MTSHCYSDTDTINQELTIHLHSIDCFMQTMLHPIHHTTGLSSLGHTTDLRAVNPPLHTAHVFRLLSHLAPLYLLLKLKPPSCMSLAPNPPYHLTGWYLPQPQQTPQNWPLPRLTMPSKCWCQPTQSSANYPVLWLNYLQGAMHLYSSSAHHLHSMTRSRL